MSVEKILLINPNVSTLPFAQYFDAMRKRPADPPLGLLSIATHLRKLGYTVKVIDNYLECFGDTSLIQEIQLFDPDLIGFSVMSFTWPSVKQTLYRMRARGIKTQVVLGGPHITVCQNVDQIFFPLMADNIDNVVLVQGEGETAFAKIAAAPTKYRDTVVSGQSDIGTVKFIWRDFVQMERYPRNFDIYLRNVHPVDNISTSRGCPFDCDFCSSKHIWGRKYKYRKLEDIETELNYLTSTYLTKGLYIREDNFTVNKSRVLDFCDLVSNYGLKWVCESRVDSVDEDLLSAMKKAGLVAMWFGIESGNSETLEFLNKGISLRDSFNAISLCKNQGIRTGATFMVGLPNETREMIHDTIKFACDLQPDVAGFYSYIGIPESRIYEMVRDNRWYHCNWNNILIPSYPWLDWTEIYELQEKAKTAFLRSKMKHKVKTLSFFNWNDIKKGAKYIKRGAHL